MAKDDEPRDAARKSAASQNLISVSPLIVTRRIIHIHGGTAPKNGCAQAKKWLKTLTPEQN